MPLALLEDPLAARETLQLYERMLGSPVYLRPTDKGLTVISLDAEPRATVGVGAINGSNKDLLFLHQEWRFTQGGKLDVLALDQTTGQLVAIEVEQSEALARASATVAQGKAYVALLASAWDDFVAYFQRLASALARIYDLRVPSITAGQPPRVEVWWPGGHQRVPVQQVSSARALTRG